MPVKQFFAVDDSPTERHVLIELLTRNGYQVITAENGEEGGEGEEGASDLISWMSSCPA